MKKIKKIIKDMDMVLLVTTIGLLIFGLLNIVTASSKNVVVVYNLPLYSYFFQQLISIGIACVAGLFILNIPTNNYKKIIYLLYGLVVALLLYLMFFGVYHNGSKNWVNIYKFSFQPSELAKPVIIVVTAILFEKYLKKYNSKDIKKSIGPLLKIFLAGLLLPLIVILNKDFGTGIIMMFIFLIMYFVSPIKRALKLKSIGIFLIGTFIAGTIALAATGDILSSDRKERLTSFINPCSNYYGGGYQICNGYIAINDGGLTGVGIGESKQVSYIPEAHTDSVFAIISEEYGLLGGLIIFLVYLTILYRIFKLSFRTGNIRNKYICYGIGIYIFLHIFINLGGLFGMIPLTGVPLPFLSYGGTFMIALLLSLFVVQRIHIETERERIRVRMKSI